MNYRKWLLTGLLLVAVWVAAVAPVAQAQTGASRVRFLHAVPGAPNMDVYLDGARVAADVAYGEATPHFNVTDGSHQVALRQAGTDAAAAPLLEVAVPLSANLAFMVVVQGTPDALSAVLYEDILDPLDPGFARLTAVNAIADAPALDVVTAEGGALLQGVSFGVQFGSINIPTSAQNLVMVPAGGAVDSAIATVGDISLQSGVLYTLVTLGTLDGDVTPTTLVLTNAVNPAEGAIRVRVAHGSPDAGAVDVYANDQLLVPNLNLGGITPHFALPAGDYAFALRPAGAAAGDAPVFAADVTLDAATPAVTLVARGEVADSSLTVDVVPDDVADLPAEQARVKVINAVPGGTAAVALSGAATIELASALEASAGSDVVDVASGEYVLTASVQGLETPVDVAVPATSFMGGTYYTVLVYGGGAANGLVDARVAGTELNITPASMPSATGGAAVAAEPTPAEAAPVEATPTEAAGEPTPAEAAPAEATPTEAAVEPTPAEAAPAEATATDAPAAELPTATPADAASSEVVQATPTQSTELVQTTPTTDPASSEVVVGEATPTLAPIGAQPAKPIAYVQLDPGANLHCRQLPGSTALSLGLIPSGQTLTVVGRTGTALEPETGSPTPIPTPVVEALEELWLSVEWYPEGGGYVRCWGAAQFLRVEFQGKLLDTLEELWALPEEPFNRPGEVVDANITSPTPVYDAIVTTVNLDPGVSLQLRRNPQTSAESLDLVPAQAQLEVLGYAEVPSEGLVGQPTDPNWLYVRYRKENQGATIGWVSLQYVGAITKLDRTVPLTDLVVIDPSEDGYYETPGIQPVIPLEQQSIVAVVNLDAGANLNLRDRPSSDGRVVIGIPSGGSMTVNGRNGDGTWLQVTYTAPTGDLEGWIATQYVIVTRGGQPVDLKIITNVTTDPDVLNGAAPAVSPTPGGEVTLTPTPGG